MAQMILSFFSFLVSLHCIVAQLTGLEDFNNNIPEKKRICICVVNKIEALTKECDEKYALIIKVPSLGSFRLGDFKSYTSALKGICEGSGDFSLGSTDYKLDASLRLRFEAGYDLLYETYYDNEDLESYQLVDFKSDRLDAINAYKQGVQSCGIGKIPAKEYLDSLDN